MHGSLERSKVVRWPRYRTLPCLTRDISSSTSLSHLGTERTIVGQQAQVLYWRSARQYSLIACSLQIYKYFITDRSWSSLRTCWGLTLDRSAQCGLRAREVAPWVLGTGPSPLFPFRNVVDCTPTERSTAYTQ